MAYPKYYDLNIGENVLIHLDIEDGLKEIISNSIDEHMSGNINEEVKIYKNVQNKWCIRDYGRGIKQEHFKFNINKEKEKDCKYIGFFGYGLKDAICILNNKKIKFKIYTKQYIYTPTIRAKQECPDDESLHIQVIKNTTYEIEKGTEFVFDNLTLNHIKKAKDKFIMFIKPNINFEIDGNKMFKMDLFQSVFINGVKVLNNTGYHFSYDIMSTDKIREYFNRDRKDIDLKKLNKNIDTNILKKIEFSENKYNFITLITDILKFNKKNMLQEFDSMMILRNLIYQLNETQDYVFVGNDENITEFQKECIEEEGKEIIKIGSIINEKFKINCTKELSNKEIFYGKKYKNLDNEITTLAHYPDNIHPPKPSSDDYIVIFIQKWELANKKSFPQKLKDELYKLSKDELLDDDTEIDENTE
jgi:hypothetical protein